MVQTAYFYSFIFQRRYWYLFKYTVVLLSAHRTFFFFFASEKQTSARLKHCAKLPFFFSLSIHTQNLSIPFFKSPRWIFSTIEF